MSKIYNIVIYKTIEKGIEVAKSCIFYIDGSVVESTYNYGIDEYTKYVNENSIKDFRDKIGKDKLFLFSSEEEFRKEYNNFFPPKFRPVQSTESAIPINNFKQSTESTNNSKQNIGSVIPVIKPYEPQDLSNEDEEEDIIVYPQNGNAVGSKEKHIYKTGQKDNKSNVTPTVVTSTTQDDKVKKQKKKDKINSKDSKKEIITILVLGAITASVVGLSLILKKCSKTGTIIDDQGNKTNQGNNGARRNPRNNGKLYNNDYYDNYTYSQLLGVTYNGYQRTAMVNASSSLISFNASFANNYIEEGNDIRAALSFDEVVALQQAYNNYSSEQIKAYFNGQEVDATYMTKAYKSASLQLTGAYVIETSEHPVDMSMLIDSQEGKDFYNKYHAMYLNAKEATGEERVELINEFYKTLKEDFPITEEVRTEGMAHFDDYTSLKDYQLAVTPIIAAAEMIFQKEDIDYTLNDIEIEFFNDIGLCNLADDKFERIETIMLGAYEDTINPLFVQYRRAIISEAVKNNSYVIDDEHRELSGLNRFQEVVNSENHKTTYSGEYGSPYTEDYGEDTIKTWTDTTTESHTDSETIISDGPVSDEDKAKVDDSINTENENARSEAEKAAEEEAARQQAEADQNKADVEKEVEEENNKTQEEIDSINTTINDDNMPNENDYNNVDFDDNHSNNNGDLNDSVQNVTTDGARADEPLPDPNDYGKDFDTKQKTKNSTKPPASVKTANTKVEYDQEYPEFDADGNPVKNKVKVR